jgi:hypothetical protein
MYPCVGFSDVVAMCRIMRLCIIEFVTLLNCICRNLRIHWLIGTCFKLMTKLTMKVDLKFLVRRRFIQCWNRRKKTTVSNRRGGKVVVLLIGFRMIVMINLLSFRYCSNYQGSVRCLTEIIM